MSRASATASASSSSSRLRSCALASRACPCDRGGRAFASFGATFAQLVLDAACEATLLAGALNARRGGSNVVMLTRLGGRAFGNDGRWIDAAMRRALGRVIDADRDVGRPGTAAVDLR